jgi:tetraacyldisaccharide 4'-kinase
MFENLIRKQWQTQNLLTWVLMPFALLYMMLLILRRNWQKPKAVSVPVICVGSRYVGGAGKTPISLALAKLFENEKVAFVSRGYGGRLSSKVHPIKVDLNRHDAVDVGDEPMILAAFRPTYICIDRYKAANLAVSEGASLIILDDGLQNFSLYQDIKIAVEDPRLSGNNLIFPAGPLREAKFVANLVLSLNQDFAIIAQNPPQKGKFLAFCGLASPQKFATTLRENNIEVEQFISYPDHHQYSEHEIKQLISKAKRQNLRLITTQKDYCKIPPIFKEEIYCLEITAELNEIAKMKLQYLLKEHSAKVAARLK